MLLAALSLCASLVVLDGDTIVCDGEHIRLLNIDAPELHHAKCADELRRGLLAKRRLEALLTPGITEIRRGYHRRQIDRFGRTLALVFILEGDVGVILVQEKLARQWTGRREPWC